jgi:RNA polymerase sigma-70 factor, ECF subfamily
MSLQPSMSEFRAPCAGNAALRPAKRPISVTKNHARTGRAEATRACSQALTSDDDLIRRIAGHDASAMHLLYERYRAKAFNYIHRIVREIEDVEDLVSQTFLEVWHAAGTFERRSSVSTWLLAIARFKAFHHFRRRKRDRIDDVEMPEQIDDAESAETMIDRVKLNEALRACVSKLDPARRKVVDLVYYQERSVIEASEILGIPCATVKTRMFYARKDLAILLAGAGIDGASCGLRASMP